jgi:hypothetical protein
MSASGALDYERTDVAPRLVGWLASGLMLFLALAPVLLAAVYPASLVRRSVMEPATIFPAPRLQVRPARDLAAFRGAEEARLAGFGWNDPARQSLHIPIDLAMSLVVQRGLPAWPKP